MPELKSQGSMTARPKRLRKKAISKGWSSTVR